MSYEFYKILHILAVIFVFIALAGFVYSGKKSFGIAHGVGLLIILVSGFGQAARLGLVSGLPTWVWIKIGVWVVVGAIYAVAKRKALSPAVQICLWLVLAGIAVYAAVVKPLI